MKILTALPTAKPSSSGRILAFDGLRGFAAFIVVVFHYLAMLHPQWVPGFASAPALLADTPLALLWNGPFAVSVFFVLSGFVMAAAAERRHEYLIENVLTRYLRLALPALASVLLAWVWLSLLPTAAQDLAASLDAPSAWINFTIQAPIPGIGVAVHDGLLGNFITRNSAFNNVLWTMRIELVGSVFLFLVYWLGGFTRWLRFLALAGFAVLGLRVLGDPYLCFVTGALIYEARKAGLLERLPPAAGVLALALGIMLGAPGQGFADRWGLDVLPGRLQPGNAWGLVPVLAASLILLGVQLLESMKRWFEKAPLQWLGRISFALYLVHVPLLYTFVAWERVAWGLPSPLVAAVYVTVVLALAHLFTLIVDEPSLRLLSRVRKISAALRAQRGAPMIPTHTPQVARAPLWSWVLLATAALMPMALINGGASVYPDSSVYLNKPEGFLRLLSSVLPFLDPAVEGAADAVQTATPVAAQAGNVDADAKETRFVFSGRSMYYQIFAWSTLEFGRLWSMVAVHAFLVAYPAALLLSRVVGVAPGWPFVLAMSALGLLTPLGLFVGVAMPDILSGVLVLVIAVLMSGWTALTWAERGVLFAIATFAMVSHTSHLLLGLALTLVMLALPLRNGAMWRGAALIGLACLSVIGLEQVQKTLQERHTGRVVLTRPHLIAHLVDHGPGVSYLQTACPEAGFEMCNHVENLPIGWIAFLFGGETPETRFYTDAPPEVQIAISREQIPFTVAVVAHDPIAVFDFAAQAALFQLARFDPASGLLPKSSLPHFRQAFPDWLVSQTERSVLLNSEWILPWLHMSTWVSTLLALGALAWALRDGQSVAARPGLVVICTALVLGVVLNAAICGILASPYDRFQARIIWLIPLAALALLAASTRPAKQLTTDERAAEPAGIGQGRSQ